MAPRGGRWRPLARPPARHGLRQGRRQRRRRRRPASSRSAPGDDRQGRPRARAAPLRRCRPFGGRASALAVGADRALQLPLLRARRRPLVVRRRHRPHSRLRNRGRRAPLPPHAQGGVRPPRSRLLPALQEVVRRLLPPPPPRRGARRRRHLLRRPARPRARSALRLRRRLRSGLRARLPTARRARHRAPVGRPREPLAGAAPRPLRRVQPDVRPRHPLRVANGRTHREHPHVAAAAGALGVRARARAGKRRGGDARGAAPAARVGVSAAVVESRRMPGAVPTPALPTPERLLTLVDELADQPVIMLVDLVADRFITGAPKRISREAPVLILRYEHEEVLPGGGANAVANVVALGGRPLPVGIVGADASGDELLAAFAARGIPTEGIRRRDGYRTPTKVRILAGGRHSIKQQVVRYDVEGELALADEDRAFLDAQLRRLEGQARVAVLSDYGYGAVDPSLVAPARAAVGDSGTLLCDSRYRLAEFGGVDGATPNEEEAEKTIGRPLGERAALHVAGATPRGRVGARVVVVSPGARRGGVFVP